METNDGGVAEAITKDTAPPHQYGLQTCITCKQLKSLTDFPLTTGMQVCNSCLGNPPGKFHPYTGSDGNTHSLGIRPHPHGKQIARDLLSVASKPQYKKVELDVTIELTGGRKIHILYNKA